MEQDDNSVDSEVIGEDTMTTEINEKFDQDHHTVQNDSAMLGLTKLLEWWAAQVPSGGI